MFKCNVSIQNNGATFRMQASSLRGRLVSQLQIHANCWHHLVVSLINHHRRHRLNCTEKQRDIWLIKTNIQTLKGRKKTTVRYSSFKLAVVQIQYLQTSGCFCRCLISFNSVHLSIHYIIKLICPEKKTQITHFKSNLN